MSDTTAFWASEAERTAELDAARAEGAATERRRLVTAIRARYFGTSYLADAMDALADDIEAGRL